MLVKGRLALPGLCIVLLCLCAAGLSPAQTAAPVPPAASQPSGEAPPATTPAAGLPAEGIRPSGPGISDFNCKDLDVRLALRMLAGLGNKNIICTKEVTGTITVDLYKVTFKEALDAVMRIGGYAYREKDNFIYVMTPQQHADSVKAEQKLSVRAFRLAYVTANDAQTLIKPALSSDGSVAVTPAAAAGIANSKTETGGNSLAVNDIIVVRDYEENIERVGRILEQIDVKPDQILVEAVILRATLTEDNALGVDFNALAGVDFAKVSTVTDAPDLQALTTGAVAGAQNRAAAFRTGTVSGIGSGGLSMGFFSNNIALFIKALETVTDVTVVANPKLLIVNKQRGEVLIGDRTGYLTTTVTETVATQTVQFLDGGTRLIVRPFIARDGYIRMEIHPEDSATTTKEVTGTAGTNVIPSQKTTEATSNVIVRDGHTIVIGGLFRENTKTDRTQVPILGNIPYVGTLFRKTADNTVREEVIILITPRIVQQARDEAVSEQLKDDVERFRLGQRKGLRWWGRDRLANCHVRQARQDLQENRRASALWNIDMALSLEPRMEEAIRLKERLTEKAFWADESQFSSAQNIIQRMLMNDLDKATERNIVPGKPRDASQADPDVREKFGAAPRIEDPLPGAVPGGVRMETTVPEPAPQPSPAGSSMIEKNPVDLPTLETVPGQGAEAAASDGPSPEAVPEDLPVAAQAENPVAPVPGLAEAPALPAAQDQTPEDEPMDEEEEEGLQPEE